MNADEPAPDWQQRLGWGLLVLALVAAVGLMVPGLATAPLGIDELASFWIADSDSPGTLWTRSLNYSATPPVTFLVEAGFLQIGGKSVLSLRLPTVLGYLIGIVFTFLFARELLGPIPAGLAAHLLTWHPDVVDRMRQARMYGLTCGLAAVLLWVSLRWCRAQNSSRWMLAWIVTAMAVIWTHYLNVPLGGLVALWLLGLSWLKVDRQQSPTWRLPLAWAILVGACLPLLPSLLRLMDWAGILNYRDQPPALWLSISPYWWVTLPAGLAVAWLGTSISRLARGPVGAVMPRAGASTFALLLVLGCLPVIAFAVVPTGTLATLAEQRYRIVYAPATAVLLAACLTAGRNWLAATIATLVGIVLAWSAVNERPWQSHELSVPAATDWATLSQRLQAVGQPNEPLFVYGGLAESKLVPIFHDDPLFHEYLASRAGRFLVETPHPRYALPWVWSHRPELLHVYQQALQRAASTGVPSAWLAASTDTDLGRDSVQQFLRMAAADGFHEADRLELPAAVLIRLTGR